MDTYLYIKMETENNNEVIIKPKLTRKEYLKEYLKEYRQKNKNKLNEDKLYKYYNCYKEIRRLKKYPRCDLFI
jgi:hypothetical protein